MAGSERSRRGVRRTGVGLLSVALAVWALGACSRGDETGASAAPSVTASPVQASTASLVEVVREIGDGMDYTTHDSPEGLHKEAALTVVGIVESIADGRVFGVGPTREDEPVFLASTLIVKVDEVLEGDKSLVTDGYVYVELPRTKEYPVDELVKATPKGQQVILFLSDYTEGRGNVPLVKKAPTVPAGAPILAPYVDGFLLEDTESGELVGGLVPLEEQAASWSEGTSSVDAFVGKHFETK